MGMLMYAGLFLFSFLLSLLLTPAAGRLSWKLKKVDEPGGLKTHLTPTPRLGGAAIFVSFIFPLVLARLVPEYFLAGQKITLHFFTWGIKGIGGILVGAGIIFLLGLVEDLKGLSILTRFLGQTTAAVILLLCTIKIRFLPGEFLNDLVSILWVVGLTNAFNIIDILDGLAGGVAFIASAVFFLLSVTAGHYYSGLIAVALAGSILGFLRYNFPRAKIFMGDSGSLCLGFILSGLAMSEQYTLNNRLAVLAPLLVLATPVFETLFVVVMRLRGRKPVFYGSFDHFPLRLVRSGWSKNKTVLFIYAVAAILGTLAFLTTRLGFVSTALIYLFVLAAVLWSAWRLSIVKVD